jgi:predicted DCC family thiol-disulfide oxidoreductase YuxK
MSTTNQALYGFRNDPTVPPFDDKHALIVFDGVCVLCSGWFRFVARYDRARRFRFATAQSPLGQALYRHYGMDPVDFRSNLVIINGRLYTELDAFSAVMARLPVPWPLFGALKYLPKPVADFIYFRIARNRYRLFGRSEACLLPTPALKALFAENGWV